MLDRIGVLGEPQVAGILEGQQKDRGSPPLIPGRMGHAVNDPDHLEPCKLENLFGIQNG